MILIAGLSGCQKTYYHEPVTLVGLPRLTPITKQEQQAVSFCLGKHEVVPEDLDCSIDGMGILRKVADNITKLKAAIIEQRLINEKHNEQ